MTSHVRPMTYQHVQRLSSMATSLALYLSVSCEDVTRHTICIMFEPLRKLDVGPILMLISQVSGFASHHHHLVLSPSRSHLLEYCHFFSRRFFFTMFTIFLLYLRGGSTFHMSTRWIPMSLMSRELFLLYDFLSPQGLDSLIEAVACPSHLLSRPSPPTFSCCLEEVTLGFSSRQDYLHSTPWHPKSIVFHLR